jgi:hypothetical protein
MRELISPLGWVLLVTGVCLLLWSLVAPAAPQFSGTVSFELLVAKVLYAVTGAASMVTGAVFVAAGVVAPPVPAPPAADRGDGPAPQGGDPAGGVNQAGVF